MPGSQSGWPSQRRSSSGDCGGTDVKIVVDADTGKILGITAVAKDAGELAAAGVHVLGKTVAEVADAWAPYLTMAEGIRIAAKAFTTDPSLLSCCA